ncbi:ATP-grasp domain-containing protein [Chondromyces apiculatus]|uniref:Putative membrane protein n=1 Tax=Chondromyces apiculatus DSM 436 TaxID=1192034 RepID=A0A017ST19_9BACT|nr:ATP-grasp domain-containing protein [Chondromyces apiculatus]EYF00089.1 putative membrane protein [Chondromyces apiculatus DSM 436]
MRILFPSWPGERRVDAAFEGELEAARAAGFEVGFVDVELHLGGEARLWNAGPGPALYRGWLLKPDDYARLAEGVAARGGALLTTADDYRHASDFPRWYEALAGTTPRSVWFRAGDLDALMPAIPAALVDTFGSGASLLLKDFVKSRKQDWYDACFIRDVADEDNVRRVIRNFLELQGDAFTGGLVFREFIALRRVGVHPKSRMPLVNEWRFFVAQGKVVYHAPYWSDGASYEGLAPPEIHDVERLVAGVKLPFFAVDLAEREVGGWAVIEINDGGTAGVPDGGSVAAFYEALRGAPCETPR